MSMSARVHTVQLLELSHDALRQQQPALAAVLLTALLRSHLRTTKPTRVFEEQVALLVIELARATPAVLSVRQADQVRHRPTNTGGADALLPGQHPPQRSEPRPFL